MSYAICAACGNRKFDYLIRCSSCDHLPSSDEDFARALILSSDFELDSLGLPKSDDELAQIGAAIKAGEGDCIADDDLKVVKKFLRQMTKLRSFATVPKVLIFMVIPAMLLVFFVIFVFVAIIRL
jgi:hypothetical protein